MSKVQIHTDVVQRLKEAGYELDVDGNFIHKEEEEEEMGSKVVLPTDPNWYEQLLDLRELEELPKHKEEGTMSKVERTAATIGRSVAKAECWTRDSGIPTVKTGAKEAGKAAVKAGKALRRFGKGMVAGYKAAKE
jgi:hypothetical protein